MSSTEEVRSYLLKMIERPPISDADGIVEQRHQFLNVALYQPHLIDGAIDGDGIKDLQQRLEAVRTTFWQLPEGQLLELLSADEFRRVPELSMLADKLRRWAHLRPQFPLIAKRFGKKLALFEQLRQLVALPPVGAAGLQERILRQMQRGMSKEYKSQVRILSSEFPQVYAMEQHWFEDILSFQRVGKSASLLTDEEIANQPGMYDPNEYEKPRGNSIWAFVIIAIFLSQILRAFVQR